MLTSLFAECCVINTDSSLYSCRCWSAIKKPKIGHTDWSTPPQFKSNARKNHVAEKGNQLTHSILSAWIIPEQCKMYQLPALSASVSSPASHHGTMAPSRQPLPHLWDLANAPFLFTLVKETLSFSFFSSSLCKTLNVLIQWYWPGWWWGSSHSAFWGLKSTFLKEIGVLYKIWSVME